jgi:alkylation response protein AidB-like acyl-CoA dehydrogenase
MNERRSLGSGVLKPSSLPRRLAELGRRHGTLDLVTRHELVDIYIQAELNRFLSLRNLTAALHGRHPGPEGSVGKLAATKFNVEVANLGVKLLGASGMAVDEEDKRWMTRFLWGPGHRLGGGTDEVNRNVVAERVLSLPGEPLRDDTVPWSEIPRSVR